MRYIFLFCPLLFGLPFSWVWATEPCFSPSWSRPVSVIGPGIGSTRTIVPTPYVVERPTIISESIPIRISPPIRETVLSYESPVVLPRSGSITTTVSDSPNSVSDRFFPASGWRPQESRLVSLQSVPDIEVAEENTNHLAVDQGSTLLETSRIETIADSDLKLPEAPDRTTVRRPTRPEEKTLEPLPEPPKKDGASRLAIPPPFPTILGQSGSTFGSELQEALAQPPPLPQGPVDPKVISPKLVDFREEPSVGFTPMGPAETIYEGRDRDLKPTDPPHRLHSEEGVSLGDSPINGILLITTIVSVMTLIYMIFIAIDYHQRWIHSLTTQNRAFASGWSEDGALDEVDFYGRSSYGLGESDVSGFGRIGSELLGGARYSGYGGEV